jgi:DMSO reductase anchor subunit
VEKKFKPSAFIGFTGLSNTSLSREILAALIVKFILLSGLWWLFFAGNKLPVDDQRVHTLFFNESEGSIERK